MLRLLTLAILLLVFSGKALSSDTYMVLSSGEKGTPYYDVAKEISEYIESSEEQVKVYVGESEGSVDNISRLKTGLSDYIVVQQDVALDAYFDPDEPYTNFEIILPLFPEALQILVAGEKNRLNLTAFASMIRSGEVTSMNIGPSGSATNQLMRSIFSIFGISAPSGFFHENAVTDAISSFNGYDLDSVAHISAYPSSLFVGISRSDVGIVSFNNDEIEHIQNHVPGMSLIETSGRSYSFDQTDVPVLSIGTWALLAGQTGAGEARSNNLADVIVAGALKAESSESLLKRSFMSEGLFGLDAGGKVVALPALASRDFFRGLSLSPELLTLLGDETLSISIYSVLIFSALSLALFYFYSRKKDIDMVILWNRYQHIFYSLAFVIVAYFILAFFIISSERNLALTSGLSNSFDEVNAFDVHTWLFIFSLTGYNGVLFPQTFWGQMLVTTSAFLLPIGAIGAIIGEFLFNYQDRKRRQGVLAVKNQNHIVICGWNDRVPTLIAKAINAQENYLVGEKSKIVVVAEEFGEILNHDEEMERLHKRRDVEYISGKARDPYILEKANIDKAKTVILVADGKALDSDERTLLSALSISRFCREKCEDKGLDNIYMIAEVNHEELRNTILNADVNEVVNVSDIGESLVVQSMFNHGVSTAISNMVAYNEFNEFYVVDAEKVPTLIGKRFDEILPILRQHRILLTSIKSVIRDPEGKIIIDDKAIRAHLARFDLKRQIVTNPITEAENTYRLMNTDQLILLSPSMQVIDGYVKSQCVVTKVQREEEMA